MVPSDSYQIRAITLLVEYLGWNWVGLIQSNSTYVAMESDHIVHNFQKSGICIAYRASVSETDPPEIIREVVNTMKTAPTKIVIAFAALADMEVLLREVVRQNVTGIQWVGSESWVASPILSPEQSARFLTGTLGFVVPDRNVPGLKDFLLRVSPLRSPRNPLVDAFWEKSFGCAMPRPQDVAGKDTSSPPGQCTGTERLQDITNPYTDTSHLHVSFRVFNAMFAIAQALHNMLSCEENGCAETQDFLSHQVGGLWR